MLKVETVVEAMMAIDMLNSSTLFFIRVNCDRDDVELDDNGDDCRRMITSAPTLCNMVVSMFNVMMRYENQSHVYCFAIFFLLGDSI